MLTWRGVRSTRLESARVLLGAEGRLRASGRIVTAADGDAEAYNASFELTVDESGALSRLLLRSTTADEERQVQISRSEEGIWLVDYGQGAQRGSFDGALDVDLEGAVLFNTLPIRRLGLHREPGEHRLPVLFVALPTLTTRLEQQTYRTLDAGPDQETAVINYRDADISADLTVDADGLVLDYPGLATRT
jgi:hypothetical protein